MVVAVVFHNVCVALAPTTVAFLNVSVPVVAPMLTAVAALPKLIVVAVVFNKLNDVADVVKLPPLICKSSDITAVV